VSAAVVYVFVQTGRDSRHTAEANARFAAATAAKELGSGIATLKATVDGIARTPNIEHGAAQPTCQLEFSLGDLSRGHVDVIRPDGSVACSSRPRPAHGTLAGYAGARWLTKVTTSSTMLLAPVRDAATGEVSSLTAERTGRGWTVAAFVALTPIARGLADLYGGGRPVEFLITSADGRTVLTRSIDPARWVGAPLAGTAFARNGGRDVDGTARLYEHSVVPGTGWRFYAGEDKSAALAAGNHLRERELAIILAGFLLMLLSTWAVYRRVALPIRRLGSHVRASAALTPPAPVPAEGPAEVADLGNDINGLIAAVGQAEEALRTSETSYRRLFETSPLPMWIHDADTLAILAVNDAAVAHYGYSREEFLSLSGADLAAPDEPGETHVRKDGSLLKVRTLSQPITFEEREARCVVAENVGDRERLEQQLRQAQKLEAVGQLAGGVAHDFNNLLTVIAGYSGVARNRIGAGPGARELAEIDQATERATQLTRQLLAFSRQQVLRPELLDLNEVIEAVTPMLARLIGDDIQIGMLAAPDLSPVLADRGQIEQVIVNLVVNARDAMPRGGTVTIETREVRLDERYAAEHAGVEPGLYTSLSITDTGVGIDRETQSRIFEPFFTTKDVGAGTGLGLATVHGIVRQSGGHLGLYSEPGLGTSFKVYLPAAEGVPAQQAYAAPQRRGDLSGNETVIVCEDDELVRLLLETILTENGYRVLSAAGPEEAIAIAGGAGATADLLVTDAVMPRMSGVELIERLRADRPDLRVILLSGYPAEVLRDRGLPETSSFLQKPFDDVTLLQRIRALLDGDEVEGGGDSRAQSASTS
jgi:two-component system cell cycle sensor histidine kinase/response regulator CckA